MANSHVCRRLSTHGPTVETFPRSPEDHFAQCGTTEIGASARAPAMRQSLTARDEILGNIKRALELDVHPEINKASPFTCDELHELVLAINRKCAEKRDDLINQFQTEVTRVGGRFYAAKTPEAALQYIEDICSERKATTIIGWDSALPNAIALQERLRKSGIEFVVEADAGEFRRAVTTADVGVSGVDFALADTGTLVLVAREGQARSVSLLPPVHIALVRLSQIISGLDDLFPLLNQQSGASDGAVSSAITFITGPSRTADIELTLVVGVHGPQQLHVILLGADRGQGSTSEEDH